MAENIERRLQEHNKGKVKSTKYYKPWSLFYTEYVGNRSCARKKEKYYKAASGKRKLKLLLATNHPEWLTEQTNIV